MEQLKLPLKDKTFADVSWCWRDVWYVTEDCENWSKERCEDFLARVANNLAEEMVSAGWDFLTSIIGEYENEL